MKKNFLVTTGLIDTWEINENNFLLGKWCEFNKTNYFDDKKLKSKISVVKNKHHWENNEKQIADYKYLKKKIEYLLEIISEKLSIIHNVNETKEYWRVILYNWMVMYVTSVFDRWENIRIFFEENKDKKFCSNIIPFKDVEFIPKNHNNFIENCHDDKWNHIIFSRLFYFIKNSNLLLIKKENIKYNLEEKKFSEKQRLSLFIRSIKIIDNIISKFALKFNKIIFESFYFPKKEYLKICLKHKLLPSKYSNFFDFVIQKKTVLKDDKRTKIKNLLSKVDTKDQFVSFLLLNIHKDMPESYLESFDKIKEKLLPYTKKKKVIFSMYSLLQNDNFKIYIAETKKFGSKYIHTEHGGGLTLINNPYFDFVEKVSDKIITWDNTEKKKDIFDNLSPTLPILKLNKQKPGNDCSIVFFEFAKYIIKYNRGPGLDQSVHFFNELIQFVNQLDPEIRSKIKFRSKGKISFDAEKQFSDIFGKSTIDKISFKNPFEKTILNSKLIIVTYPQTAFSEAMYSNTPTILIIKKDHWQFSESALHIFNILKENKIAFENFNDAKNHINEYWNEMDVWWKRKNVQFARKKFLENFFNVKSDWYKEWSDYIYSVTF